MARGDRIYVNLPVGQFWLQEGFGFDQSPAGEPDRGERVLLTRTDTPRTMWPQRGALHPQFNRMFVQRVSDRGLESGLTELRISYIGSVTGTDKPHRITPNVDVQMFQLPALDSALKVRWVAPVPQPTLLREYVAFEEPTLNGVGGAAAGDWLPAAPSFSLTFTPDPDEPLVRNYYTGWRLVARTWPNDSIGCYPVREYYAYFNTLA